MGITNLYYIYIEVSAKNVVTILPIRSYFVNILTLLQIPSKKQVPLHCLFALFISTIYHQTTNISRTLVGNKHVDH